MSIAIVLIPLALPAIPVLIGLRIALGKDSFERMINSLNIRIPTTLTSQEELAEVVRGGGYDFKPWMGGFKTHLQGGAFFTWELQEGRWVAVVPRNASQHALSTFIQKIEASSGRSLFTHELKDSPTLKTERIPTNFKDRDMLLKSMLDAGLNPSSESNGQLTCLLGTTTVCFIASEDGAYEVEFENAINREELIQHLLTLDDDYRQCVQASTYEQLMTRLSTSSFVVDSEEVLADNSIVLTITVPD